MRHYFAFFLMSISLSLFAVPPREGVERLMDGNKRYVSDRLEHPNRTQESRAAVAEGQEPFAVILGCADSRVAPEILFDQGIGDLFVVRVAGNVAGNLELESIQYAIDHLGSSVVMVLGHEHCGAVSAVVQGQTGDIPAIAKLIQPAVKTAKKESGNLIENAIDANVQRVVEKLRQTKFLKPLIKQGKVTVIGGVYHLETGKVELISK